MSRHAFLDHPGPIPFAHRGGAWESPENSVQAFDDAVRLGFRYLETDVHLTADGVLVAFHDDVLDRVTDRVGRLEELPWSEVRQARIEGTGEIPTLEHLLMRWPDTRINIDPKTDRSVEPLIEMIRLTGSAERVCVGSFSDRRIERIATALAGRVCVGMGPRATARLWARGFGVPSGTIVGDCAQVPMSYKGIRVVTDRFVIEARRRGIPVHVWTIDDAEQMGRLLDLGVNGIMTDRPRVLRAVLEERGLWHEP
ncbi:MAG: glycerophosphodiester phosphodiesterase [Acidimicrobiales bacterium]